MHEVNAEVNGTVTVAEARDDKRLLESDIARLVQQFTERTGLIVHGIDVSAAEVSFPGGGREHFYSRVRVEVRLP